MQINIGQNIKNISKEIESTCKSCDRDPKNIKLIAVSKKQDLKYIKMALQNGINNFGENYAQELHEKCIHFNSKEITWHFIGPMQSNKIKIIAKHAAWVHALNREKIIIKLNEECKKINKTIRACIQVNISNESSKSGCLPEDLLKIAKLVKTMKNIELKGIMALPRLYEDNTRALQEMKMIIDLSKRLQKKYPNASEISLGTTCDFKNAIISGSTMLRIGESIFGKRK